MKKPVKPKKITMTYSKPLRFDIKHFDKDERVPNYSYTRSYSGQTDWGGESKEGAYTRQLQKLEQIKKETYDLATWRRTYSDLKNPEPNARACWAIYPIAEPSHNELGEVAP